MRSSQPHARQPPLFADRSRESAPVGGLEDLRAAARLVPQDETVATALSQCEARLAAAMKAASKAKRGRGERAGRHRGRRQAGEY